MAHPAFTLFLGGSAAQGAEGLGAPVCTMLQDDVPAFLVELGRTVQASGQTYAQWAAQNGEALRALAGKYAK